MPIFDQQAVYTTDDAGFDKAKEKITDYLFKLMAVPIANGKTGIFRNMNKG